MKICMLTWEFPPRIVGGIARHCYGLAKALAQYGHEVHVITLDFPGTPSYEEMDGLRVYRTAVELGHPSFITWVLLFNHFMEKKAANVSHLVKFDLVHIHDWLTAQVGISLKHHLRKPMVLTVHSTEHGRSGLNNPDSYTIDGIEWWATYEASRVIVTSEFMKREVCGHFRLPQGKVEVIPNAIEVTKFSISVDRESVRLRYGVRHNEKLVLSVGRLVPQKGIEYFIQAIPLIVGKHPDTKFIIVGDGWMRNHLEELSRSTGCRQRIRFTGFIPDSELRELMMSSDVLVVPSVYEPFGIVALEGMAAGVPVVASQVGGLAEIIEHDRTGVFVYPRSPESIAWGVDYVLSNPDHSKWLARNAWENVRRVYSWEAAAKRTIKIYEEVVK